LRLVFARGWHAGFAAATPPVPVVGASWSDWQLVGYYISVAEGWMEVPEEQKGERDVVPLYRKRADK
jgi:hypothetical protein